MDSFGTASFRKPWYIVVDNGTTSSGAVFVPYCALYVLLYKASIMLLMTRLPIHYIRDEVIVFAQFIVLGYAFIELGSWAPSVIQLPTYP